MGTLLERVRYIAGCQVLVVWPLTVRLPDSNPPMLATTRLKDHVLHRSDARRRVREISAAHSLWKLLPLSHHQIRQELQGVWLSVGEGFLAQGKDFFVRELVEQLLLLLHVELLLHLLVVSLLVRTKFPMSFCCA